VYGPERRCDRELPDCVDDAQPNRHAGQIAIVREFLGSFDAFRRSLVAVAREHQVGNAPDFDFRYHAERLPGEPLLTVNSRHREPREQGGGIRNGSSPWVIDESSTLLRSGYAVAEQ